MFPQPVSKDATRAVKRRNVSSTHGRGRRRFLDTRQGPRTQVLHGTHVYAKDVRPGDRLDYFDGAAFHSSAVRTITETTKTGLYNPYTLSGSLVVDGIAASCHSSWILDGVAYRTRRVLPTYAKYYAFANRLRPTNTTRVLNVLYRTFPPRDESPEFPRLNRVLKRVLGGSPL